MLEKIIKKIQKWKFLKTLKKEKRRIFIDNIEKKTFSNKRKKMTIKFPSFGEIFNKKNLIYFLISISFIVFIGFITLIFSPILSVKTINIETIGDDNSLIDINILYSATQKFREKNILFLKKDDISENLINYEKNISEIKISKDIFKRIITIKLSSYKGIYHTKLPGKNYIITQNGVFIPTNNTKRLLSYKEIKLVNLLNKTEFYDYKKILNEKYLEKIQSIIKKTEENMLGVKIKNIYYFEKERELHIDTQNDIKFIFDINSDDIDEQIKKVVIFNKDSFSLVKNNDIIYIDLRIKNKIYYCTKEKEFSCRKNLKLIYGY